ncbi:hypothetical protein D7V88_40130 [Corallococcus terminator]|uniref:DUF4233 domain-containing protein n=1 Tax=Corallococcus terminator TaxID=2316733 RepID=A0A3A8HEL6_9BACT|nr:hypothetical protein D7V88_40130 [Corallococcus terminator]
MGVVATLLSALYQSGIVALGQLVLSFQGFDRDHPLTEPFFPALLAVWIPTLCALFGLGLGKRTLHVGGMWGLWLLVAGWSAASIVGLIHSGPVWPLFLPWHLALWAAWTMRPGPDPKAPAPQPASKR